MSDSPYNEGFRWIPSKSIVSMKVILTNTGSYPRIGDSQELQLLRRTIAAWERRKKTGEELAAAEAQLTRLAIEEQAKAGIELVTDGQIRWYDPISHLAGKLGGVKIKGLLRFFDTNFYFRQPVVEAALSRKNGMILSEFEQARAISPRPVKPVLTGPYTLAKFSIANHEPYRKLEALALAYGEALAAEVAALTRAGASVIQVDEPAILKFPADYAVFSSAFSLLAARKGSAELALYTYFGDAEPLYARFHELPVEAIGLDFTYSPRLVDVVRTSGSNKALGLGLIDGRNTRRDEPKPVLAALEKMLPAIRAEHCYLNPSCGLEYLPRDHAFEKLKKMAAIQRALQGAR